MTTPAVFPLTGSLALGRRAIQLWTRNPASIAGAVVFPLIFFGLFNLSMRRVMGAQGFDYAQLLPPTIVVQAMFFTAMSSAYYVAIDRSSGMLARLRSLPIGRAAPIMARSIGDMSRGVLSASVLMVVGVATGMRFATGVVGALAFLAVAVVFAAVVSAGIGLIGYLAPSPDAALALGTVPYIPLLMLSSGFAPVSGFPTWLQGFARHQPTSRTIDLLRVVAGGEPTSEAFLWWVGWMVGLGVLFATIAVTLIGRNP